MLFATSALAMSTADICRLTVSGVCRAFGRLPAPSRLTQARCVGCWWSARGPTDTLAVPESRSNVSTGADDCVSSNAVAPDLTPYAPARVRDAGAAGSRLRTRHRDTSPGGSYGTPGAGASAKGARMCRRSARKGFRLREADAAHSQRRVVEGAVPPVDGSLPLARLARSDDADEHADHQGEANVSAQYQRGHDRQYNAEDC